ncbi:hypothetical protein SGFS_061170 [Streptomyces graminofaciens]|uniref:Guanylate cyclase domain-containing protein n=1 Tax=Streptomyces graminofaciens TaxID=68212 RepID=A0ABM7FEB0_9ACTN|nr:hypothetical protein [Streptomyces graminofaciens]BBC34823.1 hypothetical protein SGFS_061170 [Streptomyces graminofaciens]
MVSSTEPCSPAQYSLIAVLDIEGFGRRTDPDQAWLRERLRVVVARALDAAHIDELSSEDRGDAVVLLIPGTVPKTDLLGGFVRALVAGLRDHARDHTGDRAMRLRVAVHAGEVARHGEGWVGTDLNTAFRMADMEPLRRALAGAPDAVLSLAVSHVLHQGVLRHHHPGLEAHEFAPVVLSGKEIKDETVWIRVPGHPAPATSSSSAGPTPPQKPPAPEPAPANYGISATHVTVTGVGVNHGTVTQSWTGPVATGSDATAADLHHELARLRGELKEALRREEIDDVTFEASEEELDTAERHARAEDEEGRGRLLRALTKLKALMADTAALAGLVATVTQLIQQVRGQA